MINHIRAYTCLPETVLSRKHAENPPTKDGFDRSIRIKLSKPAEPTVNNDRIRQNRSFKCMLLYDLSFIFVSFKYHAS
jgi:hypothetical protein